MKNSNIFRLPENVEEKVIQNADKISVLDGGKIVGQGKHEDLYKTCLIYKTLYDEQFLKYNNRK